MDWTVFFLFYHFTILRDISFNIDAIASKSDTFKKNSMEIAWCILLSKNDGRRKLSHARVMRSQEDLKVRNIHVVVSTMTAFSSRARRRNFRPLRRRVFLLWPSFQLRSKHNEAPDPPYWCLRLFLFWDMEERE